MHSAEEFTDPVQTRDIYSISRLNAEARSLLEGSFPLLWVEGEISNFACPASGHWYFSLKDQAAQVRCAMFRNRNAHLGFVPKNGMQVLIRARISLYEARGEFQIITEHMEQAGDGALRRQFEELKKRLMQQGLFATEHKKPLPASIQSIGVITSPSGAAIRDILTTIQRRYPAAKVIVYPVSVQGNESAGQIARMLQTVQQRNEVDVILLSRGGGSLEDLWSFNEEVVARAIYDCTIPVVCGVGHEIDFTIADFVADYRAATPTAAAELVTPNQFELLNQLQQLSSRLKQILKNSLTSRAQKLEWLGQRLVDPRRRLQDIAQRCDELQLRLSSAQMRNLRHAKLTTKHLTDRLARLHPEKEVYRREEQLQYLSNRLNEHSKHVLQQSKHRFSQASATLHAVSPLATIERGYSIVSQQDTDQLVRSVIQVKSGERVRARLKDGNLLCEIKDIETD